MTESSDKQRIYPGVSRARLLPWGPDKPVDRQYGTLIATYQDEYEGCYRFARDDGCEIDLDYTEIRWCTVNTPEHALKTVTMAVRVAMACDDMDDRDEAFVNIAEFLNDFADFMVDQKNQPSTDPQPNHNPDCPPPEQSCS